MVKLLITVGLLFAITTSSQFNFDKTTHDFGQVEQGVISCTFTVYNTGHQPLLVSKVNSSCGCLVFSWPKEPIMPGDSGIF